MITSAHQSVPDPEPLAWTSAQAAAALQVCDKTVLSMAKRGELPARKVGRVWRFSPDALRDWLTNSARDGPVTKKASQGSNPRGT